LLWCRQPTTAATAASSQKMRASQYRSMYIVHFEQFM